MKWHGVDVGQRRRSSLRPREIADDRTCVVQWYVGRPAQQNPQRKTTLAKLAQQLLPDKSGAAGKGDGRVMGAERENLAPMLPRKHRDDPVSGVDREEPRSLH